MSYLPAAASLAAAHKGKLQNICAATLRETKEERNPGVVVLQFENETLKYDQQQTKQFGSLGELYDLQEILMHNIIFT